VLGANFMQNKLNEGKSTLGKVFGLICDFVFLKSAFDKEAIIEDPIFP
jgi:hypothetical protein